MAQDRRNWAGNLTYAAPRLHVPGNVEEVRAVVRGAEKVRAVGTRHSFNAIADTDGEQISLERMARVLGVEDSKVTVEAGIRYGDLAVWLQERGWALRNLASLPHISVAGAVATATHGSGIGNGCLATAVEGLEMVMADGTVREFSRERDGEIFRGMVVSLGALGVVTKLTLEIVPTFEVRQYIFEGLSHAALERHFAAIMAAGYSVSLFTDWRGDSINQVWIKQRVERGTTDAESVAEVSPTCFDATPAPADRHPIAGISAENCTPQMGVPGPWHERLPHFRMAFTPSSGAELQSEYFVPRECGVAAFHALARLRERIAPHLLISEIRTIAADRLRMSPFYGRDSVAFHFTWKPDWPAVHGVLPAIEEALLPFGVRAHWGKLFTLPPAALRAGYARLGDFVALAREFDPAGKFRNAFVNACIFDPL